MGHPVQGKNESERMFYRVQIYVYTEFEPLNLQLNSHHHVNHLPLLRNLCTTPNSKIATVFSGTGAPERSIGCPQNCPIALVIGSTPKKS